MPSKNSLRKNPKISLSILALAILAGFANNHVAASAKPQSAVSLAYQFLEGKTLAYQTTSAQTQNLDVMGQTMSSVSNSEIEFTLQPRGLKEGHYQLGVTINSFQVEAQSPQGGVAADASSVVGKSFDMVISRLGKEVDTSGASSLRYSLGIVGTRNLGSDFQALFPDLPEGSVKIGDTWPSEDTVIQNTDAGEIRLNFKNMNTPEGSETVDGFECLRIKSEVKGTMTGNFEQQGLFFMLDAKIDGTQIWYFSVKEGIFVKSETKSGFGGVITAGDPANLTIPITGEIRSETRLIKK